MVEAGEVAVVGLVIVGVGVADADPDPEPPSVMI